MKINHKYPKISLQNYILNLPNELIKKIENFIINLILYDSMPISKTNHTHSKTNQTHSKTNHTPCNTNETFSKTVPTYNNVDDPISIEWIDVSSKSSKKNKKKPSKKEEDNQVQQISDNNVCDNIKSLIDKFSKTKLDYDYETIQLNFVIDGQKIQRIYCKDNIDWFSAKVQNKLHEIERLTHDPKVCGLLHYHPKTFNDGNLCGYALAKIPCPYGKKCNMIHSTNFPQIETIDSFDNKEKTIVENNKKYNSAGVLIFCDSLDGQNVYLFQSTNRVPKGKNVGEYYYGVAAGGICNKDVSVSDAARRELFEESCKTFMISQETLNINYDNGSYIEIPAKSFTGTREHGNFRCYVCNLTGQANSMKNFYENNLEIISNLNTDRVYKETKKIGVFDIKAFDMLESMSFKEIKPMQVYDNENNVCFIDERTLKSLWTIINRNKNVFNITSNLPYTEFYEDEDDVTTLFF